VRLLYGKHLTNSDLMKTCFYLAKHLKKCISIS
jgi:hypothetical protein